MRTYRETSYRTAMDMVRAHESGLSFSAVGRKYGYHRTTVSRIVSGNRILHREGIREPDRIHPRRGLNDLKRLANADYCYPETDASCVSAGAPTQCVAFKGKSPFTISDQDRQDMIEARENGVRVAEIARRFKRTRQAVYQVLKEREKVRAVVSAMKPPRPLPEKFEYVDCVPKKKKRKR